MIEICSDAEIKQACKQDENVARAVKHSHSIGHSVQMIMIDVHILAGQQKDDHDKEAKKYVREFHPAARSITRLPEVLCSCLIAQACL